MDDDNKKEENTTNKEERSLTEKAGSIINKVKTVKTIGPIIAAIAPFLGWILLGAVVIIMLLMTITYFSQIVQGVTTGLDKFVNFITFQGWDTSQNVFYKKLNEEYISYNSLGNKEGEFDIPLIVSTIHYRELVAPDTFTKSGNEQYTYDQSNPVINSNNNNSFYILANDKLGSVYSVLPGDKKLIGHLVDIKFTNQCVDIPETWVEALDLNNWSDLTGSVAIAFDDIVSYFSKLIKETKTGILDRFNTWKLLRLVIADIHDGKGLDNIASDIRNNGYELLNNNAVAEIYRIVKQSDLTGKCGENQIALPVMMRFINEDYYKEYLKNEYLITQDYNTCPTCEWQIAKNNNDTINMDRIINREIDEIFAQRNAYRDLQGGLTPSMINSLFCATGVVISNGSDAGVYNLEDYVAGVVTHENDYQDPNDPDNIESIEAQAIAARTYVLNRTNNCTQPIEDSTSAQTFSKIPSERAKKAASATAGKVLTYKGRIFSSEYDAYYCTEVAVCLAGGMCTCEYTKEPYVDANGNPTSLANAVKHTVSIPTNSIAYGGGGHGRGMSQEASNYLQTQGWKYDQILKYFYADGVEIVTMGSENGVDGKVSVENGVYYIPKNEVSGLPGSRGSGPSGFNIYFWQRISNFFNAAKVAGYTIGYTDAWRSYDSQVECYNNPEKVTESGEHLCALPGTSMHGWGIAADLDFYGVKAAKDWAHTYALQYGLDFAVCENYFGGNCKEDWHVQPVQIEKR